MSLDLDGIELKTSLRLILRQLNLGYYVKDGLLLITCLDAEDYQEAVHPGRHRMGMAAGRDGRRAGAAAGSADRVRVARADPAPIGPGSAGVGVPGNPGESPHPGEGVFSTLSPWERMSARRTGEGPGTCPTSSIAAEALIRPFGAPSPGE